MFYLNLDADGYLQSIFQTDAGAPEDTPAIASLEGLDLAGDRIGAYRWDGEKLVLNEAKITAIEASEKAAAARENIAELKERLSATDGAVISALENIFSATSATGLITALKNAGEGVRDVLAERKSLREQIETLINEAEGGGADG